MVPTSKREAEIIALQTHEYLGHHSEKDVLIAIQEKYWIPNAAKLAKRMMNSCQACQVHKHPSNVLKMPMQHMA